MIALSLFDLQPIWAVQAVGIGVAGLVLMIGRFITTASDRRSRASQGKRTPTSPADELRRLSAKRPAPDSEITTRVEDVWK
jgi:hypothetical protein